MNGWEVSGDGGLIVVRSPDGEVFRFAYADAARGHLTTPIESVLQTVRTPDHSDDLVEEAKRQALAWTRKEYGLPLP